MVVRFKETDVWAYLRCVRKGKKQIDLKNAGRKKRKTATSETSWARGRGFEEKRAVNYK